MLDVFLPQEKSWKETVQQLYTLGFLNAEGLNYKCQVEVYAIKGGV